MGHEPDLNRLAALAEGRLDVQARQELMAHLADCRECREIVALLARRELAASAAPAWWSRPMNWLPIAATLVIASLAALLLNPNRSALTPPPSPSGFDRALPADNAAGQPANATTPAGSSSATGQPPGDLTQRRTAGIREAGSKTFRLVAGEWVDSSYDPNAGLPVVEASGADRRRELLERIPALAPYAEIADRVTVVYEGTVYRIAR